jgi:peptidyl-prolyl cis-trans isomerase SurA
MHLIEENIKIQKANNLNIEISNEQMKKAISNMEKQQKLKAGHFARILKSKKISKESWKQKIKADLIWQKIIKQEIMPKIQIQEFEIEEAMNYLAKDSKHSKFKLAEIYIPIFSTNSKSNKKEVEKLALKLEQDIKNKGSFTEMVRQFSRSNSASSNGQLGWVEETVLNEAILNELKQTTKNNITKPIYIGNKTSGGFYIFQLQDIKTEQNINDQTKREIENFIYMNKISIKSKQYLADLYKNSFIEFNTNTYQ